MSNGVRAFLQRSVKGYIKVSSSCASELVVSAKTPAYVTSLVTRGPAGAPGRAGIDGGALTVIAAESLGGFRAVTIEGFHCEGTDPVELAKYAGVTLSAVVVGDEVQVQKNGEIHLTGETLTPNSPIFIGAIGVLTQTLPMNSTRRIGWAVSTEIVNLDPFPYILGD